VINGYVLSLLQQERAEQDAKWGERHDDAHHPNDWIAILARHLGLAASDGSEIDLTRYKKQLVRIAAVAIAALETLQRQTTPSEKVASYLPNPDRSGA
jgi:hypothetical protein